MDKKSRNTRYLGGWEIYFENKEPTIGFLKTHGVDKEGFKFFKELQAALEFEVEGNRLIRGYRHQRDKKELRWSDIELPITDWEQHSVFLLEKDPNGEHRIGGPFPQELTLPTHPDLTTPFQYIGTLDCTDTYFKWIGMEKLHIVFPLYECNYGIYLDYNNPLKPQVVEPITFSDDWYDPSLEDFKVQYSQVNYRATSILDVKKYDKQGALLCGVPLWYQFPDVPRCPISKEPMRFISSIGSDPKINVVNEVGGRDQFLIFGDMGHLMLFYNPETKILCAYMEH